MSRHNVFRDGRVHVRLEMCSTCIFRPGNLMHLPSGYLRRLVEQTNDDDAAIICHQTLEHDNAVCRGFYERWPTTPLVLATEMDLIAWAT